ncbi:CDP-glycerol:glycerophosphate glycerophosphotransferase [Gracilibacillus timonensis]|uniref:CDP-glycerol:glycerophosphate glycerophosphotransferase n=1 Tax=Gracilibacillus timonensis TaxID=1816696 RepID=UPI000825ECA9|nr:CDP-glycerol:glycerophosphate glycerophosphotransferase [Gracilibacillus timonensis]
MLFSIVIPFKETNIEYTKNCIESLEEQYMKDFEVLFVYQDPTQINYLFEGVTFNYRLIQMEETSNVSIFRNKGLSEVRGEYVLFLDSDDFLHPNALVYAKKVIDSEYAEVIRLKIKGTRFDKRTTLNNNNQAFYKDDTSAQLTKIFDKLEINVTNEQQTALINELFEENILNANCNVKTQNKFLKTINRSLKVHGFIFKRQILMDHQLLFDESLDLYGEVPFLIQIYNKVLSIQETTVGLYYKLIHSDSVNYPSLSQEVREERFFQFYRALRNGLMEVDNLSVARQVKRKAINYYLYKIAKSDYFSAGFNENMPMYQELQEILNIDSEFINLVARHRLEISTIKRGKFRIAYFFSKSRVKLYELTRYLKPKNKNLRRKIVQQYIFTKLPAISLFSNSKKTVVFESFHGKQYSDNPRAIYEYMKENYPSYQLYWSADKQSLSVFEKHQLQTLTRFSWKWLWTMSRADYWVINSRLPNWMTKSAKTKYLQTWHGTPLKKLGLDLDDVHMPGTNPEQYKYNFKQEALKWDYLVAPNRYSSNIFTRAFGFEGKVLETGYPRNDFIVNHQKDHETIDQIKQKLTIAPEKKVILYAPTWRDNQYFGKGRYKYQAELDLHMLQQELGEDYVVILRMHYLVADHIDLTGLDNFVVDGSTYEDIRELYLISDILITDYSSVFFDYANLKRPIIFFVYDLEEYRDTLRGFYFDFEQDAPGPLVKTNQQVLAEVKKLEQNVFEPSGTELAFYQRFCYLEEGKASEKVIEDVFHSSETFRVEEDVLE